MNKNKKIIQRVLSMILCMALIFTSMNLPNLFNNIAAIEETEKTIISFVDDNIVIKADTLSNALYKLPYTIEVNLSDGTTEEIAISDWKEYSDEGEVDSVNTYYYEMILDTKYELLSTIQTPLATILIEENASSLQTSDDNYVIVDDGVYEIKGTMSETVCINCFGDVNDGICATCGKNENDCTCEEQDIDLNNQYAIDAWMEKYTPEFKNYDYLGWEILEYDDIWWDRLKPNQKKLAETIYKCIVYNDVKINLLSDYLQNCTMTKLIAFLDNNKCNFDINEYYSNNQDAIQYITREQLEAIKEIDPSLTFLDYLHMFHYCESHPEASKDTIKKVKPYIFLMDDEDFDALYEITQNILTNKYQTSLAKKMYKTSLLISDNNNIIRLTASTAVATSSSMDTCAGVDYSFTVNGETAACGTKGYHAPSGQEFSQVGTGNTGTIASIINYMSVISPSDTAAYSFAQRVIWYQLGQLDWGSVRPGGGWSSYSTFCNVLKNGGTIPSGFPGAGTVISSGGTYYKWQYNESYQVMLTAGGPPEPEHEPPEEFDPTDNYRSRLIVKHNLTGTIDDNGVGVMGKWTPGSLTYSYNDNINWTHSGGSGATYCSSIVDKTSGFGTTTYTTTAQKALTSTESFPSLGGSNKHYDYSTSDVTTPDKQVGNVIYEGYITRTYTWTTHSDHYCENSSSSHSIVKPTVDNYTLTLHYQGGYYDDGYEGFDTYSTMNNTCNYANVSSFDDTLGEDRVSTEKTNVKFKTMAITGSYKLNSFTTSCSPHPAAGTLTKSGNNWSFKHNATSDGVQTVVEFSYANYYIVTLPTPKRVGYNFLGWYTAATGGTKVEPKTITANGTSFSNAYVLKKDTTLYAHWELITKNETFEIKWLDNYNNYTTRPEAVYVELWRYTTDTDAENCEGYITEELNKGTKDWITRFSNETGLSNKGTPFYSGGTKTSTIFDPNVYLSFTSSTNNTKNTYNNIFSYRDDINDIDRYVIKVQLEGLDSGDNKNPANSNTWQFTLKNLQKFDTQCESWHEYTYVIKEVICESLDETTYYYTSPNNNDNNYTRPMSHYYNIKNDNSSSSGAQSFSEYEKLDIKTNFSKVAVNRIGNSVKGVNPWKSVVVQIHYNDASDKYHFRPYSLKVQLYQNLANYKNTSSENYLDKSGVRILYRTENAQMNSGYAYSSVNRIGFDNGAGRNWFFVRFEDLPTVEDSTGIKIAYDAVLTYGQSRYRYTIDDTDEYNNLGQSIKNYGSNHYYSIKHQTNIQSIIDLNYTYMKKDGQIKYIGTDIPKNQVLNYWYAGWYFEPDNMNDIFQAANSINSGSLLKNDYDDTSYSIDVANQKIRYNDGKLGYASSFPSGYKSMAYNLRYYYITESNEMKSMPRYNQLPFNVSNDKKTEYLFYTETLHWTFNVDLNGSNLTMSPTEYSGSNSSDDRTGNYNGSVDDDYSHTNNKLTITSNVKNQSGAHIDAEDTAYKNLQIDQNQEAFLITLKQIKKNWTGSSDSTGESYTNNNYPANGYIYYNYDTSRNRLTRIFQPEASASGTGYTAVGNEYNIVVPANGSVTLEYLPDGKYEVTCHYDIDFSNFAFATTAGKTASIVKESNGKYYLIFSSATVQDNQDITHSATIDYWRGYVDDMNNFSWARPLRDNNFGLVSGTPSNVSDKTLYPFGNGDEKNAVSYGTSTIKNIPNSYSVYEYNGNIKKYANKCPIHGTILTNGKCTNSDCAYSNYQYYSNGSNIVDDKLPYNVYSQYKGTERNTLK